MTDSTAIEASFHFCPRCGSANDGVGVIPFRCDDCGMAHFFGPVAAVGGLLVDDQGRLLMVRRSRDPGRGKWGLPGGFVDRDETIEQALAREVLEETNLVVTSFDLMLTGPNEYVYEGVLSPVIDLFYICSVNDVDCLQLAPDELDACEWCIPTDEHLKNMAFESNRIAVQHWLNQVRDEHVGHA